MDRIKMDCKKRDGCSPGRFVIKQIRETIASELEWDGRRWKQEIDNYNLTWKKYYSPKIENPENS